MFRSGKSARIQVVGIVELGETEQRKRLVKHLLQSKARF
jgi:hypothetical protein